MVFGVKHRCSKETTCTAKRVIVNLEVVREWDTQRYTVCFIDRADASRRCQ